MSNFFKKNKTLKNKRILKEFKPKSILDSISAFCKNNQTVGIPIIELYHCFQSIPNSPKITFKQFEGDLTTLNKYVIKDLQLKCYNYINENGAKSYDQFINNVEFVTQSFWNTVVFNITQKLEHTIFKNTSHEKTSNTIKTVSENNTKELDTSCEKVPKIDKTQEELGHKNLSSINWDAYNIEDYKNTIYEKILKTSDEQRDQEYINLLPVNWDIMNKSERIDFTKRMQHKEFYNYVLRKDPQIDHYIKGIKKEKNNKISIYVNLFSFPSDTTSEESKALLKSFVESLNMLGRARLQYVELNDPRIIEIREVRK